MSEKTAQSEEKVGPRCPKCDVVGAGNISADRRSEDQKLITVEYCNKCGHIYNTHTEWTVAPGSGW